MARITDFSVGRRWRSKTRGRFGPDVHIEFLITDKGYMTSDPDRENPAEKICVIRADDHRHKTRGCNFAHETIGQYSHKHLKKHAVLLPLDAPPQNAVKETK